jgi:hypothetical protein
MSVDRGTVVCFEIFMLEFWYSVRYIIIIIYIIYSVRRLGRKRASDPHSPQSPGANFNKKINFRFILVLVELVGLGHLYKRGTVMLSVEFITLFFFKLLKLTKVVPFYVV